jgi:putative acetyltransferase
VVESPATAHDGVIRPYADHDLDQLVDIWYRASLLAHPFLSDAFLETERPAIANKWLPMSETIVYEVDDAVVGFLSLVGNEVGGLFIAPEHQRNGIGRALMDAARDSRPFLELSVFEANTGARRFYEDYGFVFVRRQPNAETGLPELRLRLDHRTAY